VRAGWLLEELTFQNFGFSETARAGFSLQPPPKSDPPDPYASEALVPGTEAFRLRPAVLRADSWYAKHGHGWSRFEAIREALLSDDPFRQLKALSYLGGGVSPCAGLTMQSFHLVLEPIVRALASSATDHAVKRQAELLLADDGGFWWLMKTAHELREWAYPFPTN
jgi:hypothetical protein